MRRKKRDCTIATAKYYYQEYKTFKNWVCIRALAVKTFLGKYATKESISKDTRLVELANDSIGQGTEGWTTYTRKCQGSYQHQ